jgi:hypothetical protein
LLSAIEICKGYKNILLGYPIIVFTDHKNTFNGLKVKASDRVLRWLLTLEFEYLPRKKSVVSDALSRLDFESLKIQEEELLTLLSGAENNSISNIKFTMHSFLIFKEQGKVKHVGLREKGLSPTSLLNTTYWGVWSSLLQRNDLHSSIIETEGKKSADLVPWIFTSSGTD